MPAAPKRSRRQTAGLVLAFGMVALALGVSLNAIFGRAPKRAATTTTIPVTTTTLPDVSDLGPEGVELQKLLDLAAGVAYHGVYDVEDPSLPEGLSQSFEVWRDGENARTDIIERQGGGRTVTRSVTNGSISITCRPIQGAEQCERTSNSAVIDLAGLFVKAIAFAEEPVTLTARDDEVGDYVARCFEAEEIGELCLATDGVLLSTILEGANITLARLDDRIPEKTFDVTIPNRKVPVTPTSEASTTSTVPATTQASPAP
ncbi:MAG: hypothetical protein M3Z03_04520 [Actinomycetota bacterium]|nr:hypothetical protein [Actinomycetota bacterium]